jgi:hypothetical protein
LGCLQFVLGRRIDFQGRRSVHLHDVYAIHR